VWLTYRAPSNTASSSARTSAAAAFAALAAERIVAVRGSKRVMAKAKATRAMSA